MSCTARQVHLPCLTLHEDKKPESAQAAWQLWPLLMTVVRLQLPLAGSSGQVPKLR